MDPIYFDLFGHQFSIFDSENDIIPKGLDNQIRLFLSGAPVVGGMVRAEDNWRYTNDYLRNRGMDWSDVKYPTRLPSMPVFNSLASGLNFVSKNIEHLYD